MPDRNFEQLARGVVAVADSFGASAYDASKPYKPGCTARLDGHRQRHYAGSWSRQPVDNLHMHSVGYLRRAEDHLRTIALAIPAPRILYSPLSLARVVAVSSGQCFYLLDPGVDTRERMRRGMNLHAQSLTEERNMVGADNDSASRQLHTEIDQLCDDAVRLGFNVRDRKHPYKPPCFDGKIPTDTTVVTQVLDASEPYGKFAFRLLSAAVHSQPNIDKLMDLHVLSPSRGNERGAGRHPARDTCLACRRRCLRFPQRASADARLLRNQ